MHSPLEIRIEPLSSKHACAMQRWAQDPRISQTSNVPHPYPEGEAVRFVTKTSALPCLRVFAILVNGKFGGTVSLHHIDPKGGVARLEYWVAVPLWGRGIATEAAGLAIRYAREELGLQRLASRCLEGNTASLRVLHKLGFVAQGSFVTRPRKNGDSRFGGARVVRLHRSLAAE